LGFRSFVHIDRGACRLISRNGNQFKSFPALGEILPAELRVRSAVLDGEIVALDRMAKRNSKTCCSGVASQQPACHRTRS